jgi:hypothetical protein
MTPACEGKLKPVRILVDIVSVLTVYASAYKLALELNN